MHIESPAFVEGGMIPGTYTCDAQDISPPLIWDDPPEGTRSLALICEDPDAPLGTWVHWVYYNLPPSLRGLPAQVAPHEGPPPGGRQGLNDFGHLGYGGPCPPGGTHRYYFRIYALDTEVNLPSKATRKQLNQAMKGHILSEGQLMGRYSRS